MDNIIQKILKANEKAQRLEMYRARKREKYAAKSKEEKKAIAKKQNAKRALLPPEIKEKYRAKQREYNRILAAIKKDNKQRDKALKEKEMLANFLSAKQKHSIATISQNDNLSSKQWMFKHEVAKSSANCNKMTSASATFIPERIAKQGDLLDFSCFDQQLSTELIEMNKEVKFHQYCNNLNSYSSINASKQQVASATFIPDRTVAKEGELLDFSCFDAELSKEVIDVNKEVKFNKFCESINSNILIKAGRKPCVSNKSTLDQTVAKEYGLLDFSCFDRELNRDTTKGNEDLIMQKQCNNKTHDSIVNVNTSSFSTSNPQITYLSNNSLFNHSQWQSNTSQITIDSSLSLLNSNQNIGSIPDNYPPAHWHRPKCFKGINHYQQSEKSCFSSNFSWNQPNDLTRQPANAANYNPKFSTTCSTNSQLFNGQAAMSNSIFSNNNCPNTFSSYASDITFHQANIQNSNEEDNTKTIDKKQLTSDHHF